MSGPEARPPEREVPPASWRRRLAEFTLRIARELAIFAVVLLAVGWWMNRGLVPSGAPMPEFTFATIDHRVVSNEALAGKPTAMVVWAPWCGVCAVESSNVSRLSRWMGDRANVVSVVVGYRDYASVTEFVRKHDVDYPVLLGDEDFEDALNIERLPTIYFFDAEGKVTNRTSGYTPTLSLLVRLWLS